jgi:RecA/RadA recombinase
MRSIAEALNYKLPENVKLIANLEDKYHYRCDYRNLQLYVMLGLRVTKIHKVLEFKQTYSLKTYADTMRQRRADATGNKFLEQYYKDMMNIVYGKTVENERNYSNLEVCTSKKKAEKKINSFRFKDAHSYSENLCTINMTKNSQTLGNKPIFLGCTILELSKLLMLKYHYTIIKQRYGKKAKLLFTDTDSLMYHIETESNIYDDMIKDYQQYDFSAYDKDTQIRKKLDNMGLSEHVEQNKKCFGLMKDEQANDPIIEFGGRAPKEYSYRTASGKTTLKGKGVPGNVLNEQCSHEDAVNMILSAYDISKHSEENFSRKVSFMGFRTIDHNVYTEERVKTGMSILDSKRYVCSDGVSTLAWGHYKIPTV